MACLVGTRTGGFDVGMQGWQLLLEAAVHSLSKHQPKGQDFSHSTQMLEDSCKVAKLGRSLLAGIPAAIPAPLLRSSSLNQCLSTVT